jgi:hypothetical protein
LPVKLALINILSIKISMTYLIFLKKNKLLRGSSCGQREAGARRRSDAAVDAPT